MQVDFTKGQNQYDLSRALFGQAAAPIKGANAATALGKVLQAYLAQKGMNRGEATMLSAEKDAQDTRKLDLARALSAYRGDTPFEADLFPGEAPIPGLKNMGTGQDRNALMQAMMGANDPSIQDMGMRAMLSPQQNKSGRVPASIQEYEYLNQLSEEDQKRFMEVKRSPGAKVLDLKDKFRVIDSTGNLIGEFDKGIAKTDTAGFKSNVAAQEEAAKQQEKGKFARWNTQMDEGLQAADGLPILKRSLNLLKEGVETGGFDNLALKASNFFGVTGADEAELSANLGRAVLSQLRATFGAAFTEREGDRLAFIEASFGKSTKANIRLLEQLEKMAKREARRGIKAAEAAGDEDTAQEIREAMEFTLEEDVTPQGGGISPGTVEDGYQFKGGDPSKPENWVKIDG